MEGFVAALLKAMQRRVHVNPTLTRNFQNAILASSDEA
jgi:hypothetical protein